MTDTKLFSIKQLLLKLGLIDLSNLVLFSKDTRDKKGLSVWKDKKTGIIFIDDFYVGREEYVDGNYKYLKQKFTGEPDFERKMDLDRRVKMFSDLIYNKKILDVGCGNGDFLIKTKTIATNSFAIDIDAYGFAKLEQNGVICKTDLKLLKENSIDVAFFFHSFEHFNNPLEMLRDTYRVLKPKGKIIIEVPHAGDILLNHLYSDAFKYFTLWSQHLILHTRTSLDKIISYCGFQELKIQGVQRYPLSNHLFWLYKKKPGGHKSSLNRLDNNDLKIEYEKSLQNIDATDTLVAYATKPIL